MISGRLAPKRYQLNKQSTQVVRSGHPWVFRDHLSSAAQNFRSGQWLKLYNGQNKSEGFGIYDADGLIGVRVLKRGSQPPSCEWIQKSADIALTRRDNLRRFTNSFRAINGENDGFPGIVFDVYGRVGVLQTYSPGVDTLGRYLSIYLTEKLRLQQVLWKLPARRVGQSEKSLRQLRGQEVFEVEIQEGPLCWQAQLSTGQKSGTFLDLRGLRKWIRMQNWHRCRVLNLFSYTGSLGLAASLGGAREVWNVDAAKKALDFGRKKHRTATTTFRWLEADIFDWLPQLEPNQKFDLIVLDPPNMMVRRSQMKQALKTYRKLYLKAKQHLKPKGYLIACCCSSKIARYEFTREVDKALAGYKRVASLSPEDDHPVSFKEGDYLKVLIYRAP